MILDKDLLDFQYAEAIRAVCAKCDQGNGDAGLSYAEIVRRLGITRERVRQIAKGKPTPQKPDLQSKVMLTTTDVAQLLGLHPNTVRRWSNKGVLKSFRIGARGDRRFWREDIDGFLKEAESSGMRNG